MNVARRVVWGLGLAVALLVSCREPPPRTAFEYTEMRSKLPNGLRYVIMPDATTTQVEVDIRYNVGAKEDPPGKAGIAHLAEHIMFQQRPDGPQTPPLMQVMGQLTTYFNAYTSWDTTHYQMAGRAEQLETLLKIEAMRLYFGCQTVSEEEFLREREVVRNEIRWRGGNAEGQIPHLVLAEVYPKGHAYSRMVGGDDSNLTNISLKDVCDFMKKYYTPENATVIVAGGVDPIVTAGIIKKWFGPLEARETAPRVEVQQLKSVTKGRAQYELDIERPYVVVSWPLPDATTEEGRAASFGIFTVFFAAAAAAQDYEFAYSVQPQYLGGQYSPVFSIIIELKGMGKAEEAIEFAKKAAHLASRKFYEGTWEDMQEAKALRKGWFLENLETLAARTNTLGDVIQFDRDTDFDSGDIYLLREMERSVDFDSEYTAKVLKKTLDWDKAKVIVFKPSKTGIKGDRRAKVTFQTKSHEKKDIPEVDPREAKRPLKVAADFKVFEEAKRFELGNGMKVVLMPLDTPFPLVSVMLAFDVGEVHSSTPGMARLAARFLRTPTRSDALMRTGISLSGQADNDHTYFFAGGLDIYFDVILKSLERHITIGEYDQERVESWRKGLKEQFGRKDYQQSYEYQRQFSNAIYGPDHPYAKAAQLTPDSAESIGRDKLDGFRRKHYSAGNATLIIAGKFDAARAESLVRSVFGGWDRGTVDQPVGPEQRERTAPEFIGVVSNEAPQVQVGIAYPAPAGIDGQEAARQVLAAMLNERMGDIRFKLGSTYGVRAGRGANIGPTAYTMGGDVDAPRAGESLKAMRDGIQALRAGGDTFDIDFVRARRKLIEDLLGVSRVSGEMVFRLGNMELFGLQPDYYSQLVKQIGAVSPAQVKALIAKELDPKNEILVLKGDRPTLERTFAEAGIEQYKMVEPDYR